MENWYTRTEILIGTQALEALRSAKICIFGIGGVGSFTVEALARAGVETLTLIDGDIINPSNINRQIHATSKTIGKTKVEVMKQRILDINPKAQVKTFAEFYRPEQTTDNFFDNTYSYIIDAIDDIKAKIHLIQKANQQSIPIISAMGAANKIDPTRFEIADIYSTSVDPICRLLRKKLKSLAMPKAKVVYSQEKPHNMRDTLPESDQLAKLGSISFVPSTMGLIIAGEVVKDIITQSGI